MPRSSHAGWEPSPVRPDPIELLEQQAASRVPELVPIRYGRMLVSPFTFYRGAAYLMAADLAGSPRSGLHAQLCGDAHLSNFGGYAAPDRRLVFDMNDFDETLPGPFEWDLKRLVASFAVAGRDRGFDAARRLPINLAVTRSYRVAMAEFASMRTMDVWYSRVDVEDLMGRVGSRGERARPGSASSGTSPRHVRRTALQRSRSSPRSSTASAAIVAEPAAHRPDLATSPTATRSSRPRGYVVRKYRETLQGDRRHLLERFRVVDAARKVVGVGSVGTRAYIILFLGRDDEDPLFLQMKEAQASVLEPFLGKSEFGNHGQRVVEGQRLMQAASDLMLGWIGVDGLDGVPRDFYLRQLWDSKGSAIVEAMEPKTMEVYGRLCGQALARAHARSGDAVAISSYAGTSDSLDRALANFAERTPTRTSATTPRSEQAADSGRIEVQAGL